MSSQNADANSLNVVIVGAGLGGLACALECVRGGRLLNVTVLERAPELLPVGAGIQVPPNASRIMKHFGFSENIKRAGGIAMQNHTLRRYEDGHIIVEKPLGQKMVEEYGAEWLVIHRADYQLFLFEEAKKAGVKIVTGAEVTGVEETHLGGCTVMLKSGERLQADVVVGADGLWSRLRDFVLDKKLDPEETGDLAYRGTFSIELLEGLNDTSIDELTQASNVQVWMGPNKHVVFYPVKNHTEFNLVLLCPDNIPQGIRTLNGSLEEMRALFEGWDPRLRTMISCLTTALKWKLLHFQGLEKWTKGSVVLLGDASHPTLPYQAQGAAMAVEDGAVLGLLLRRLQEHLSHERRTMQEQIMSVLQLYQNLRKTRTQINVSGAAEKREFYHLTDGNIQEERDRLLMDLQKKHFKGSCKWSWGDEAYNDELLGFDVMDDAQTGFSDLLLRHFGDEDE